MAKGMKEYKLNSKLQEEIMVQAQLGARNRSKSWMIVIITLVALIVLGLFLLLGRELFAGKAVSFSLEKDFLASAEGGFKFLTVAASPGDTIDLPVYVSLPRDTVSKSARFKLNYDPDVLEYTGISNDVSIDSWEPVGFNGGDERAVYYSYAALTDASRPGLENEIRLATVSFKVVAPAVSTQKIYNNMLSFEYIEVNSAATGENLITSLKSAHFSQNPTVSGSSCGDGRVDSGEQCDGNEIACPAGSTGMQTCTISCTWDGSACVAVPTASVCGNGIIETGEQCDGDTSCSIGGLQGTQSCINNCQTLSLCVAGSVLPESIGEGVGLPTYDSTEDTDEVQSAGVVVGDITGDNVADTGDAIQILRYAVGLRSFTDAELSSADVTCDGSVDTGDAIQILRFTVGLRGALVCAN